MSTPKGIQKITLKCRIEGIEFPIMGCSVQNVLGTYPIATISIPPVESLSGLNFRTLIDLFISIDNGPMYLLMSGTTMGVPRYTKQLGHVIVNIQIAGFKNYLNYLPSANIAQMVYDNQDNLQMPLSYMFFNVPFSEVINTQISIPVYGKGLSWMSEKTLKGYAMYFLSLCFENEGSNKFIGDIGKKYKLWVKDKKILANSFYIEENPYYGYMESVAEFKAMHNNFTNSEEFREDYYITNMTTLDTFEAMMKRTHSIFVELNAPRCEKEKVNNNDTIKKLRRFYIGSDYYGFPPPEINVIKFDKTVSVSDINVVPPNISRLLVRLKYDDKSTDVAGYGVYVYNNNVKIVNKETKATTYQEKYSPKDVLVDTISTDVDKKKKAKSYLESSPWELRYGVRPSIINESVWYTKYGITGMADDTQRRNMIAREKFYREAFKSSSVEISIPIIDTKLIVGLPGMFIDEDNNFGYYGIVSSVSHDVYTNDAMAKTRIRLTNVQKICYDIVPNDGNDYFYHVGTVNDELAFYRRMLVHDDLKKLLIYTYNEKTPRDSVLALDTKYKDSFNTRAYIHKRGKKLIDIPELVEYSLYEPYSSGMYDSANVEVVKSIKSKYDGVII